VNRQELIEHIATETEDSKACVARILDSFVRTVQITVAEGGDVKLSGFGKCEKAKVAARTVRNPLTSEPLALPETVRPRFVPGALFKAAVIA